MQIIGRIVEEKPIEKAVEEVIKGEEKAVETSEKQPPKAKKTTKKGQIWEL